jgi:hypothetical protein
MDMLETRVTLCFVCGWPVMLVVVGIFEILSLASLLHVEIPWTGKLLS